MTKEEKQFDKFLQKIQQSKMKELWNNKEDKFWDNSQNYFSFSPF